MEGLPVLSDFGCLPPVAGTELLPLSLENILTACEESLTVYVL